MRLQDRLAERLLDLLCGGPVRMLLSGALITLAIGHWLGWWVVLAVFGYGALDFAVCAFLFLTSRWRLW